MPSDVTAVVRRYSPDGAKRPSKRSVEDDEDLLGIVEDTYGRLWTRGIVPLMTLDRRLSL